MKIDYILVSANRIAPNAYRGLQVAKTSSDHRLLVGWADVDVSRH